jgi:Polyketide cyclase / dehydrase and lipid transport
MWEYEYSLETDVNRDDLWDEWADMASWPTWNAGIVCIDIDGPFTVGTTFTMTPPHGEPVRMRLSEIDPGTVFTDEMDDGQTRVTTVHRLDTTPDGRTRISYRTTISGPAAEQIGPEITADFPDVVAALVQRASRRTTST